LRPSRGDARYRLERIALARLAALDAQVSVLKQAGNATASPNARRVRVA
jgi:hypothetical protein